MTANRDWNSPEYKKWRLAVYRRDKFKCRFPGCTSKTRKLNAHHIQRWADNPGLRYVVANGCTLCKSCHFKVTGNEEQYAAVLQAAVGVRNDAFLQALVNQINDKQKEV